MRGLLLGAVQGRLYLGSQPLDLASHPESHLRPVVSCAVGQCFQGGHKSSLIQAELIALDGSSVEASMIAWVGSPHFFSAGWPIVHYVGDDATMPDLLETILGPQFAAV